MGKMLETLKQGGTERSGTRDGATPAPALWTGPEATRPSEPEASFIEVGGKHTVYEASPDVLAAPARRPTAGTPAEKLPFFQRIDLPAALPEVRPVQFRPVAAGTRPSTTRFAPELVACHKPEHPVSKQYQSLAATLTAQLPAGAQVLLFTAPTPNVGATTVLLNLAITFARCGKGHVAVVDANEADPVLASRLGLAEAPGLREVIDGRVPLSQALQETGLPGLLALTAGRGRKAINPRGSREDAGSWIRQLREGCELVFVDVPCWDARPQMAALASLSDAVYLVTTEADNPATTRLIQTITQQGGVVRGQIVTG